MKKRSIWYIVVLSIFFSCSQWRKAPATKSNILVGYYHTPQRYLELKADSTFEFGTNGGVYAVLLRGNYEIEGIKIKLHSNKYASSLFEEEKDKIEEGYIDYKNGLLYAFGYRMKKVD